MEEELFLNENWNGVIKIYSGLMNNDARNRLIYKLLDVDILLAAKCNNNSFYEDKESNKTIIEKAKWHVENRDLQNKSNKGFLALLELNENEYVVKSLLRVNGNKYIGEVLYKLISELRNSERAESLINNLLVGKDSDKILLNIVQIIDYFPDKQKAVKIISEYLIKSHNYVPLLSLCRRININWDEVLNISLTDFINDLIYSNVKKSNKHKRINLALYLIQKNNLESDFNNKEIIDLLVKNIDSEGLSNKPQLIGIVSTLIDHLKEDNEFYKYLVGLIYEISKSKSWELLNLILELISKYDLVSNFEIYYIVDIIEGILKKGRSKAFTKVFNWISFFRVEYFFPKYENYGKISLFTILEITSNNIIVSFEEDPLERASIYKAEICKEYINKIPDNFSIGQVIKGIVMGYSEKYGYNISLKEIQK